LQNIVKLISQGENERAEKQLKKIAANDAQCFDAWYLLGVVQMNLEKTDDAIASLTKAISLRENTNALKNLTSLYIKLERYQEALNVNDRAFKLNPNDTGIQHHRGSIFFYLGQYVEAIKTYRKMIEIDPGNVPVVNDLGVTLTYVGRIHEAIELYQDLIKTCPNDPNIDFLRWNLATPLLMLGDFLRGFQLYETRTKMKVLLQKYKQVESPRWQGEAIDGKILFVRCVEGLGDSIQFLRYLPKLSQFHCSVIIEMPAHLQCIFQHLGVPFIDPKLATPQHDIHTDVMSFPYLFKTDLHSIPPPIPMNARHKPIKHRIGIAWRGHPKTPRDRHRSLHLELLDSLFKIPKIHYVCLQKDVTENERKLLDMNSIECPILDTLTDTVRVLENCERVICVDTMIAHLAGSIGIPTWILLCHVPEWRWLLERADSPWYPSARLFRQSKMDSWAEPLAEIKELLSLSNASIHSHAH